VLRLGALTIFLLVLAELITDRLVATFSTFGYPSTLERKKIHNFCEAFSSSFASLAKHGGKL
jgi:hypothetical protein